MAVINNFRELNVYQFARQETQKKNLRSRNFPVEERHSLTDQIRRSSRAVKEALGGATETPSWLDDCLDSGYISGAEFMQMDAAGQSIGGMLNKMIVRADDFCPKLEA